MGDPERADGLRPLPRRLQHQRHDARGEGQAHPVAEPPEIDEGWLCDKGRFAFGHLHARGPEPPGDRRGLALRQGTLRLRPPARDDRISEPLKKAGPRRFVKLSWDDALDEAERLLRAGGASTVTAFSGGETVEQAYALGKLLRQGLGADTAVLPEDIPDSLDAWRAPLSALRNAKTIAVLSDDPVIERAPVVELWLKAARRAGATISYERPTGPVDAIVVDDAAQAAGIDAKSVYYLPQTPNGRGVTDAWSAAGDGEPTDERPRLLIISGDEAAADPAVRAMAEAADAVIGIGLFEESFRGLVDLVLPGTSYLERDGTTVNLEGRLQRQRRAVLAPCPDELAWICDPRRALRRLALPARRAGLRRGLGSVLRRHRLRRRRRALRAAAAGRRAGRPPPPAPAPAAPADGLRLVAYRPLFSGTAVERTPELQFQRPAAEVELSRHDARARGLRNGAPVTVSSNGTSVELRARIARDLAAGTVRIPQEHAADLHAVVDVQAAEVDA